MRENGPVSAYSRKRFKVHPGAVNEAEVPSAVARGFGGRAPRTHICSDLTYVRVGASWNYACLLVDPCSREIAGHSAGPRKDARLVKPVFATPSFPISDIEVFHTDRGSKFGNAEIDLMLEAFGIERSLSAKGRPPRQRRRRVGQQDTEGRARTPRGVRHDMRAPGRALGLHAPVRQLQDPLDAGLHVSGRVQGGGAVPPGIVQIGVPNPARNLVGIAVPAEGRPLTVHTDGGAVCMGRKWRQACGPGVVRSMSRRARSPDNARAEGFFGTLKCDFFEGRDWTGVPFDEFSRLLGEYIEWYRDGKLKKDLGWKTIREYREERSYAAQRRGMVRKNVRGPKYPNSLPRGTTQPSKSSSKLIKQ